MARRPVPARPFRYSQESDVLPVSAGWLLRWAAAHVEKVGLFQGEDRFATVGRTVTLRASTLGAFDVAGGDGRGASGRIYDWPVIEAARALALEVVAEFMNGGPLEFPEDADEGERRYLRRRLVHVWGCEEGRTTEQAAEAFRAAAEVADQAEAPRLFPTVAAPAQTADRPPRSEQAGEGDLEGPEPFAMVLESAPAPGLATGKSSRSGPAAGPGEWQAMRPERFGRVTAVQPVLFAPDADAMGTGSLLDPGDQPYLA